MSHSIDEEFPQASEEVESDGRNEETDACESFTDQPFSSGQRQSEVVNIQIGPQHFDLLKLIGEGAFGKVLLVRNRLDKSLYAMKVLSKKLLKKKNNTQYMKSERDILTKVSHPFIVSLYFAFQSETKLFLVMEFLQGGELFFHLRKKGIILEKEAKFYVGELTLGIEFLHNNGVIHRDLKPENVLLRRDGHVSITDFGLAKEIGDSAMARTLCGTSEYMAPEMLTRNGYGKAVDWWALGTLAYEMLVGKPPFQGKTQKELDRKILSDKIVTPPYLAASTHAFLKAILEKDMTKRLGCARSTMFSIGGVSALKQHPFFEFMDWHALERLQLTPPFDFSALNNAGPATATATAAGAGSSAGANGGTAAAGSACTPDKAKTGDDGMALHFFDTEFTNQQLSLSMLEDTLVSSGGTPMRRSGTLSRDEDSENAVAAADIYKDFNYTKETLEYTKEQLDEFENLLQSKVAKAQKKKALKAKNQEKAAQDAAKRAAAAEEAARVKAAAEKARQEQLEYASKLKAQQARRHERLREHQAEERRVLGHNAKVQHYLEEVSKQQKKLKALRKKQRDVVELQEKVAALKAADRTYKVTAEQQQKLGRLEAIEEEIEEALEAEKEVLATCPGELLPLPVWVEDAPIEPPASMKGATAAVAAAAAAPAPGVVHQQPKDGVLSATEAAALMKLVTEEEEDTAGGAGNSKGGHIQRCPSVDSVFSGTTALEAPSTMEVSTRSAKISASGSAAGGASVSSSSIAISEVPMNAKSSASGGVDHTAPGTGKPLTLAATSSHSSCASPTDSGSEGQYTTPQSFSPLNSSRSGTAAGAAEPRRGFWGSSSSATAGAATACGSSSARPAWGASSAASTGGPAGTTPATSTGSSVDDTNWRVRKPLPEPVGPPAPKPAQAAWTSSSAAAAASTKAPSTGASTGVGAAKPAPWGSASATAKVAGSSSGGSGNSTSEVSGGGWSRGSSLPSPALAVSSVMPAPVVAASPAKPPVVAPDEWVTSASKKKPYFVRRLWKCRLETTSLLCSTSPSVSRIRITTMHLSFSRSSAHSSFSVSTGGRTFISPSTPLGMCAHSTRYIPPVPPTYVSDYQANYRLYPPEYYGGTSRRPRTKTTEASGTRQNGNTMSDGRPRTESALFEDKWDDLLSSVNKLINKSFEENTLKSVREKVQARKLDAELEFAYRHCQDLLRSTANGQSAGHGELASHPHACVSHLPEDIRNLCKEFVQKVDALKSTR